MNGAISTKILHRKSTASLEGKLPKTLSTEINSHFGIMTRFVSMHYDLLQHEPPQMP